MLDAWGSDFSPLVVRHQYGIGKLGVHLALVKELQRAKDDHGVHRNQNALSEHNVVRQPLD